MIHTYGPSETMEAMSCKGKKAAFSDVSKEMAYAEYIAGRTSILVEIDNHPTNPYISSVGARYAYVAANADEAEMFFVCVTNTDPWPKDHPSVQGRLGPFDRQTAEREAIKIASIHNGAYVYVAQALSKVSEEKTLKLIPL